MRGRVLAIGGSDSGGGAGIQADIKTIAALGGYAATAVTALTAQNTLGVQGVLPVPADFVRLQMKSVLEDIGADALKTGMLGDAAIIEAVAEIIRAHPGLPFVLDPVMVAKGGFCLLAPDALVALKLALIPLATLITPNVPEAEALSGRAIGGREDQIQVAGSLLRLGSAAVVVKGGHLAGEICADVLATDTGIEVFEAPRIATRHTHGTGCTLASAVAVGLAQGMALADAVRRARGYVQAAIAGAPGYGAGHGPLNHSVSDKGGVF